MGQGHRPAAHRLHPHSREVAALRSAMGKPWPHRACHRARACMGEEAAGARNDGRNHPPAGSHAAAVFRHCRERRSHGAALWPSGQAAGDDRLARKATDRGIRCTRTASSMAAAAPTTAMPCSPRYPRSARCRRKASRMRDASGMIETCEESGSYDLPAYLEALAPRMGNVDFVVGLDSGCGDYERLWATTSLRGLAGGTLSVEVLTEGVHSGDASGIVPSSFRIARKLLDRLEDAPPAACCRPNFTRLSLPSAPSRPGAQPMSSGDIVIAQVSVRRRDEADDQRPRRSAAQPHLAPCAVDHRRRWLAADRRCRQRAAAADRTETLAAVAADCRRRSPPSAR